MMRSKTIPSVLLSFAALTLAGCASTEASTSSADTAAAPDSATDAPAESGDAQPTAKAAEEKPAEQPAAKTAKTEGDKAAAAATAKKDDKDEEQEKKDKAQKKWDDAIEDLTKSTGLFTTYHDGNKLLLELDEKALGKPFLYFAALNSGLGNGFIYRGAMLYDSPFAMHFERRGEKKIVLRSENTRYFEGNDARETRVLKETLSDGFIKDFDIVADLEEPERILIDLGKWFQSDNLRLARGMGAKMAPSKDLSLFEEIKSFPSNVEIYQEMVFVTGTPSGGNLTMADGRGAAVQVQHSMVALPKDGYKPREFDQRVGYFYTERKDIFDRQNQDNVKRYIERWRLVKKDPSAEVSDPVEPIVYWVENSTPKAFRDAVKAGIEAWEPAFRAAGFSNAIVAKQMPDDADWDPADVNYAVVRWSEDENVGFAIGPHRVDPRTGEVIDADITMQANFLNIYALRYDTYVDGKAAMTKEQLLEEFELGKQPKELDHDDRYRCEMMGGERTYQVAAAMALLPMLDGDLTRQEFLEAMITEVTAHEIGHTLGLRHNFKASTWLDMNELADGEQTSLTGVAGSFMDYPAVNMAPPGETQGEFFQSSVGPYDMWAIEYGYKEFGSNEDKHLAKIAARSNEPGLDYGTDEDSFIGDPYTTVWDMGKDPIAFAESQLALADWGMQQMLERGAEDGDPYNHYARYYSMFNSLANRSWMGLGRFIGGFTLNRDVVGQADGRPPIVPIDAELQQRALDMMVERGLKFDGNIPDDQRLLLANKKYGSFGSWFDFWSLTPVSRTVNSTRYMALLQLTDSSLFERIANQRRLTDGEGISMRDVAYRVYDTVWPDTPDEYDMWTQSDYVDLVMMNLRRDTTPMVTALYAELLRKAEDSLGAYAGSSDAAVAAHGVWLGDKIRRYNERQMMAYD